MTLTPNSINNISLPSSIKRIFTTTTPTLMAPGGVTLTAGGVTLTPNNIVSTIKAPEPAVTVSLTSAPPVANEQVVVSLPAAPLAANTVEIPMTSDVTSPKVEVKPIVEEQTVEVTSEPAAKRAKVE